MLSSGLRWHSKLVMRKPPVGSNQVAGLGREMSKLVKKLRQINESAAQPLGFKRTSVLPSQQMLLIMALPQKDSVAWLAKAEVDAILIHSPDLEQGVQTLRQVANSVGDIPCGLWPEAMTEEGMKQLKEAGGDFLIFEASTAPAILLQEEELGKVLKVNLPQDESLISAINELPMEVVLLEVKGKGEVLTISDLMYCQWLADLVDKPLLVATHQELTDKEIQSLWEAGVDGVVVEIEEKQLQERLTRLSQALKALPPRRKRRGERRVMLTRLEQGSTMPEEI